VRVVGPDGYWVSDEKSKIDVPRVHAWISRESYWAAGRSYEVMARSIEQSLALGLYAADGAQAGFARLVTDRSTFAWLCDVFVDAAHRGRGLGMFLARVATNHPDVAGIRQVLMAEPGRSMYRQLGFGVLVSPERWMERPGDNPASLSRPRLPVERIVSAHIYASADMLAHDRPSPIRGYRQLSLSFSRNLPTMSGPGCPVAGARAVRRSVIYVPV
jgi:GNAT superfamily N-acetyltransferase